MSNTRTLLQLRTAVVTRGQYEHSNDINPVGDPSLLNDFINEAIAEIYDLIVQKWADYYTVSSTTSIVSGTDSYALPTDFYKLRKVEILMSGSNGDPNARWRRLRPHDLEARHLYSQYGLIAKGYRYRLQAGNIVLVPVPASAETIRMFYIPFSTRLSADGDTFDGINNYEELVIHTALLRCKRREELPTDDIEREIARLTARIRTAADGRDAAEPFYLSPGGPMGDDDEGGSGGSWW